jgi:hypothetical protein
MSEPFSSLDADDQQLLAQVVAYYQQTLRNDAQALERLRQRGVTNSQAIDQFRIGYGDRTLGKKLPSRYSKAGRELRGRLEQLGIFRAATGHEHFNGSVVFPITAADGSGAIVDIYGRKMQPQGLHKYCALELHLNDQRRGVWNVEALGASEEIILCPSLFDALTFWNHGYRNVTCCFGPEALTDDHLAAFQEFAIRRVLTPYENLAPRLLAAGLDCFLLKLPPGMDANTYALQSEDPAETLGAVLRKAEWLGKGVARAEPSGAREDSHRCSSPPAQDVPPELPHERATADLDDDELGDDEGLAEDADRGREVEVPAEPHVANVSGSATNDAPRVASPLPPAPQDDPVEIHADEVSMTFGTRRYRVRGLAKNTSFDQLKVNVAVSIEGRGLFVDIFDLYSAKHRRAYVVQAAEELGIEEATLKKDLGRLLLKLEQLLDQQVQALLKPKPTTPAMTAEEKSEALKLLKDPKLLDRVLADFPVVGEKTNTLMGYVAAVSRKLEEPLAIVIQSSSAAGKTALMEAVLAFVPPEDQVKFSALTGQALFYMGESSLKHKILAIVEEEGAERASYALKLLQSEGELRIASTGKDANGRLVSQEYRVEGPVMIFLTTTAITIDEELLNRCIVLTVDEDRDQTKAIHQLQRRRQTLEGLLSVQDQQRMSTLHRNAQRLLQPVLVVNPYAERLTFLDDKTRTRRDHVKYLTLIRAVALLHQYQRPTKTVEREGKEINYIEATLEDIEVANRLANEVLGRSTDDLPPQTRRLLTLINEMVTAACQRQGLDRADYRFSRRDVRDHTSWGHTQLKVHVRRLEELEYLLVHRGRGRSLLYELLFDPPADEGEGRKFLARLIDVEQLRHHSKPATAMNGRG